MCIFGVAGLMLHMEEEELAQRHCSPLDPQWSPTFSPPLALTESSISPYTPPLQLLQDHDPQRRHFLQSPSLCVSFPEEEGRVSALARRTGRDLLLALSCGVLHDDQSGLDSSMDYSREEREARVFLQERLGGSLMAVQQQVGDSGGVCGGGRLWRCGAVLLLLLLMILSALVGVAAVSGLQVA